MFAEATQRSPGLRTVDSETLIARPADCMAALGSLFDLAFDASAVAAGPAFRTHSKDRSAFTGNDRAAEEQRGKALHAREIGIVVEWAQQLAEHAGIPMTLPAPLIA
jgi:hypothetical protein